MSFSEWKELTPVSLGGLLHFLSLSYLVCVGNFLSRILSLFFISENSHPSVSWDVSLLCLYSYFTGLILSDRFRRENCRMSRNCRYTEPNSLAAPFRNFLSSTCGENKSILPRHTGEGLACIHNGISAVLASPILQVLHTRLGPVISLICTGAC